MIDIEELDAEAQEIIDGLDEADRDRLITAICDRLIKNIVVELAASAKDKNAAANEIPGIQAAIEIIETNF